MDGGIDEYINWTAQLAVQTLDGWCVGMNIAQWSHFLHKVALCFFISGGDEKDNSSRERDV